MKEDLEVEVLVDFLKKMRMRVPRKTCVKYMGVSDRYLRSIISRARELGYPIVTDTDIGGYYIAETREEASTFIRQMRSRAVKEFRAADNMELYFVTKEQGEGLFPNG